MKATDSRQVETLGKKVTKTKKTSNGTKPMSHVSSSKKVAEEEKVFQFIRGNPLGLNIVAKKDGKGDKVCLESINPKTQACQYSDNLLKGDQLVRVGNTSVTGISFEKVIDIVCNENKKCCTSSPILELAFKKTSS